MKTKVTTRSDEPPLLVEDFTYTDPETGLQAPATRYRRGILAIETIQFDLETLLSNWPSPEEFFQELQEHLRDNLAALNLPSDRQPSWVREDGGEWRPQTPADKEKRPCKLKGWAQWTARVKAQTKPLSRGLLASELLWSINLLLRQPGIEQHLWHIKQVMLHYYDYRVCGSINTLAASGRTVRLARQAGPKTRHQRAVDKRKLVWQYAQRHWDDHPALPKDGSNTARAIANPVNDELRRRTLVSAKPLSEKTIADHIRAGTRGKVFRTGQSGDETDQFGNR